MPRKDDQQQRRLHNLSVVQRETVVNVDLAGEGKRIDQVVASRLPWIRRSTIKDIADGGRLLRNGIPAPVGRKVHTGDVVTLVHPEPWEDLGEMDRIRWDTIYEDKRILVVNKPPHVVVHPAGAYRYTTLLNALHRKYLGGKIEVDESDPVPRLVHRIDKETSGVLAVAFDREAHGVLGTLFEERSDLIAKEYLALVEGQVPWDERSIELPLGAARNDPIRMRRAVVEGGQYARTDARVVERFRLFTLVRCKLLTGRQHQIRVHMKAAGHPLVGDHLYGVRDELRDNELRDAKAPRFRLDNVYLDESVSDIEAAERIREVDAIKRREYWEIEAGRPVLREGAGRLLMARCALHCAMMAFPHPDAVHAEGKIAGESMRFEAPLTSDFRLALDALRADGA